MFIQNAVLKSINAEGLSFPLAEGSVVSAGGVTGIVPTTLNVRPATNRIYVAVAGTIDMTSDANKGVTFTEEQIKALGGDFNFVPAVESGGGLPSTSGKSGKVLSVNSSGELEWAGAVLPEASGGDMGKVATVNSNGKWQIESIPPDAIFIHITWDDTNQKYTTDGYPEGWNEERPAVFVLRDDSRESYSMQYNIYREEGGAASTPIWTIVFTSIEDATSDKAVFKVFTWYYDNEYNEVVTEKVYKCSVTEQ